MKIAVAVSLLLMLSACATNPTPKDPQYSNTKTGQPAPDFAAENLAGQKFTLNDLKGQVVVLNLFATWCGPCMKKMPKLEKEIGQGYSADQVVVLNIGRGHSREELMMFKHGKRSGMTFVPDVDKRIYSLYAKQGIPRTILIGKDGIVKYHSYGYRRGDVKRLRARIDKELASG